MKPMKPADARTRRNHAWTAPDRQWKYVIILDASGTPWVQVGARQALRVSQLYASEVIAIVHELLSLAERLERAEERAQGVERRAYNLQGQVDYMCRELAAIMGLEVDTPAGTVQMVRALMEHAERMKARERGLMP